MNPIVLVGTKVDLLPSGTNLKAVKEWLREYALEKKLNVLDVHLVSNRKKTGIGKATMSILRTRNGRDVYVMGLANVGKSAFVRAFLNEMRSFGSSSFTATAMSKGRFLPVESSMPGTTLGIIKLQALKQKGAVFDTPGVHIFHRMTHLLTPDELQKAQPRRALSPYVPPSPYEICKQLFQAEALERLQDGAERSEIAERIMQEPETVDATYFWGGLVRIDIFEAPSALGLVFFGSSSLSVRAFPLLNLDDDDLETDREVNVAVLNGEMENEVVSTRILEGLEWMESSPLKKSPATDTSQDWKYDPDGDLFETMEDKAVNEPDFPVSAEHSLVDHATAVNCDKEGMDVDSSETFFGCESVLDRGGLVIAKTLEIECLGFDESLVDISISGLPGWVSVVLPNETNRKSQGVLRGRVWAPKGVEVFLRAPIPVENPLCEYHES